MVICDDIIIIAEVKAGSFTYTPAITDFEAHKNSFNSLIGKADYLHMSTSKNVTWSSFIQKIRKINLNLNAER